MDILHVKKRNGRLEKLDINKSVFKLYKCDVAHQDLKGEKE